MTNLKNWLPCLCLNKLLLNRFRRLLSDQSTGLALLVVGLNGLVGCQNQVLAPLVVKDSSVEEGAPIYRRGVRLKPNQYVVKRGDSVYGIAWRFGIDYRDLVDWNRISNKNLIFEGQVLRLSGLKAALGEPKTRYGKRISRVVTDKKKYRSGVKWRWPASGKIKYISEGSSVSGIEISGPEGSPIKSAANGTVVYSGDGLKGYGELIIVKHNESFLSAYAHSKRRLVDEGDSVKADELIGVMGATESSSNMLYFEIRRNGKAVNPVLYLPSIH